jgi:hypothetical protein
MTDKLKLYMGIKYRSHEWILSAAGIRDKQKRSEAARAIGVHELAAWMLGLDEPTIESIAKCLDRNTATHIDIPYGWFGNRNSTSTWMVRVFDKDKKTGPREFSDLNLAAVDDLRELLDLLSGMKNPAFLRCLETLQQDKAKVHIFDGDAIQAKTCNSAYISLDKLKTVLALSNEDDMRRGPEYREMIWSERQGFFDGSKKLNLDSEHAYNSHVFTMQEGWRVIGNVYIDSAFLLPPKAESEADA